jgi:hypothetical protein
MNLKPVTTGKQNRTSEEYKLVLTVGFEICNNYM